MFEGNFFFFFEKKKYNGYSSLKWNGSIYF